MCTAGLGCVTRADMRESPGKGACEQTAERGGGRTKARSSREQPGSPPRKQQRHPQAQREEGPGEAGGLGADSPQGCAAC